MVYMKIKTKNMYLVGALVVGIAIIVLISNYFTGWLSNYLTGWFVRPQVPPGTYDTFAKCLTQKGVVMYGAYWCGHCANQKAMFGDSFQYINYVECDPNGQNSNSQLCQQKGINGYPAWEINGTLYYGEKSLQELSQLSGCPLE